MLLLVVATVAPAILVIRTDIEQRAATRQQVQANSRRLVGLVAIDEESLVKSTRQLLTTLSRLPQLRDPDLAGCQEVLATILKQYSVYTNLGVAEADGLIVRSALPMESPVDIGDRLYFREALRNRGFGAGEYQIGRITGQPAINYGYAYHFGGGRGRRVVYAAVSLGWMRDVARQAELERGSTLTVTDSKGIVLVRYPDGADLIGKPSTEPPWAAGRPPAEAEGKAEVVGPDGRQRLYYWRALGPEDPSGWVSVAVPASVAYGPADRTLVRNLVALGIVATMVLLALLGGAEVLVLSHLDRLVRVARSLARGDLAARTGLKRGGGEVGELAHSIDEMAAALQRRDEERERIAVDLRRESEFNDAILGVAGALIVVLDREGRIVRFNRTCERVTGYGFEEVRGRPFWEIFLVPQEIEAVMAVWSGLRAGRFPSSHQNYWLTKSGDPRLISWANTCLVGPDARVDYVIATGIDITERHAAEEALRLNHARLEALLKLNEVGDGTEREITDFALEEAVRLTGSTIGYLAFANDDETVLTMHSWSKTAMRECAIDDKPIEYPVETTGLWGEALRQRQPVITNDYEAPSDLKKGYPEGHVAVHRHMNVPVFEGDHIVAVAGVGNKSRPYDESDVTQLRLLMDGMWRLLQRKRTREALQRAHDELEVRVQERTAELQAANEHLTREVAERRAAEERASRAAEELARSNVELEHFAYVASHDLQEPLRKIVAFGDRVAELSKGCLSEEAAGHLERVQSATRRMQGLISDLLSLSRVTTRGQPFVPIDLAEIARGVLADLEVTIEQAGATVSVGDLPTIDADPTQMRQLLQNLLGNALKFGREGVAPEVEVWATLTTSTSDADRGPGGREEACRLYVRDNGIGFDTKFLDQIFGVFQRLHRREEYPGSGIGLAICKKIVERHGGTITANSAPGKGATFVVTLPVHQAVRAGEGNHAEEQADVSPLAGGQAGAAPAADGAGAEDPAARRRTGRFWPWK